MNIKISNIFKGDKVIWMVFFFLCIISVVEVFSASSGLTYKSQDYLTPIIKHAGMLIFGAVVTVITLNIPWKYFKLTTPFLLLISLFTLIWVLVGGEDINGAQRVIKFMGQTFQPSEIAKGTLILATAHILSAMQYENGADPRAFKFIMILTLPIAGLIFVENLSTAVLLCSVIFLMMFIGRVPLRQLGKLLGIVTVIGVVVVSFVLIAGKSKDEKAAEEISKEMVVEEKKDENFIDKMFHRADTWKARLMKFIDNEEVAAKDYDLDKDAQVGHANIAIATSNVIGKGPGNSVERDFLSQAFSDFIFAIIIEEMGILGAIGVVFLYIILLFRCARIASRCERNFPAFLVMGLGLLLVIQATFNMLVAVGLAPVTGQPLPLISKGGTSTIINCAYIGAILSVSRSVKKTQTQKTKSEIEEKEAELATAKI